MTQPREFHISVKETWNGTIIQNRMALNTPALGNTFTIAKVECCMYILDKFTNFSSALHNLQNQTQTC